MPEGVLELNRGVFIDGRHSREFDCKFKSKRALRPSMKVSKISIPNQHGSQIRNTRKYNNRDLEITFAVKRNDIQSLRRDLRYILSWLSGGGKSMRIRFDDEPNLYYEGDFYDEVESEVVGSTCIFTVIYDCKPLLKSDPVKITKEVTGNTSMNVVNNGTEEHQPLIEIEGTADSITLASDGGSFSIANIRKKTIINTEKDLCYMIDEFGQKTNKLDDLTGSLAIPPGSLKIDITGQNMDAKISIYTQDVFV